MAKKVFRQYVSVKIASKIKKPTNNVKKFTIIKKEKNSLKFITKNLIKNKKIKK